jgi:glycosyltransferase involved in cell wall biosynthesis
VQADISIIVAAYNRPESLKRLLQSLQLANYGSYQNISLIISIDLSGTDECSVIAKAFEWNFGQKEVIVHPQKQGLKNHILSCGDLSKRFDAVIVLEDDLLVSPAYYQYAQQAYSFYKNEESVAGVALYNPAFNETAYCPFEPLNDGYDNYFMQIPCSWGQMWTKEQWSKFRTYVSSDAGTQQQHHLPANVQQWPDASSWKKMFYSYLTEHQFYFVYPRIGLSTNFGDTGQHITEHQTVFQTSLLLAPKKFHFSKPEQSISIYDGYFELHESVYNKWFKDHKSVSFDLNGTKPLSMISTEYLISCRKSNTPLKKFAVSCYPFESNILLDVEAPANASAFFSMDKADSFGEDKQFERLNEDVKRVFMNHEFIKHAAVFELKKQKEFQIGSAILRPLRFLKSFGKRKP